MIRWSAIAFLMTICAADAQVVGVNGISSRAGTVSAPAYVLGSEIALNPSANQYQLVLAVDPLDATKVVATTKQPSESATVIYNSTSSGSTWSSTSVSGTTSDPYVVVDASGNFHMTFIDTSNSRYTGYRKSINGGATWSSAVDINSVAVDHPCAAVDLTSGTYAGSIYVAGMSFGNNGNVYIMRSRDGGTTWATVGVNVSGYVPAGQKSLDLGFVSGPVVTADGTLVIPLKNGFTSNGTGGVQELYVMTSADGGATFSVVDVGTVTSPDGSSYNQTGWNLSPNLIHGSNGSGGDRIYYAFMQPYLSAPASLSYYTSDNDGATWSGPSAAIQPASLADSVTVSGLMINSAGVIGAQYFGISMDGNSYDVYFAYSKNRMVTFSAPILISTATSGFEGFPTQPRAPGGDATYGSAGPDGKFNVIYTRSSGSTLYYAYQRQVTVN